MVFESEIKEKALSLGFDAVGITSAEPVDTTQVQYFQRWLDADYAGQMAYMRRNIEKRFDPGKLLAGAKSVICVAMNYRFRQEEENEDSAVRIARFGQYEDYHPFMKDRLFQLAEFIKTRWRKPCESDTKQVPVKLRFKACVDSVPIAERALAQRAGLGFIGRNHMLISPELGNQILLAELITTVELRADEPMANLSCGDCGKCIRACPTGALGFDGSFDARKCISYQTIEAPIGNAGVSPANVTPASSRRCDRSRRDPSYIFGCDECILACPHELGKPPRQNMDFQYHRQWQKLTPKQIQNMTEDEFEKKFANSGFIRLGLERLKRNLP